MCVKELFGERLAMIVHIVTIAARAVNVETTNIVASSTPRGWLHRFSSDSLHSPPWIVFNAMTVDTKCLQGKIEFYNWIANKQHSVNVRTYVRM